MSPKYDEYRALFKKGRYIEAASFAETAYLKRKPKQPVPSVPMEVRHLPLEKLV